ncbi:MAG TPA: type II secretion system F family protein [Gemmatimonadaceae bacterium]|nr:type II secretion system F family protein [Gemmatimonadaceae bacterium]
MNITLIGALRSIERIRRRTEFYRSWETSLRTHKDVTLSLTQMLAPDGTEFAEVRDYLVEGLRKGRPVGVIAKLRPDAFPTLDQLLLATGEGFGTIHDSLRVLGEYYLREYARLARVRRWMAAPIVLWIVAAFVIPFPLVWDVGTQAYSAAIVAAVLALYALGGIPASLLFTFAESSDRIRRPRFAWTLAIGLEAGLTFAAAARLAASVSGYAAVGKHLDAIPPKTLKTMTLTAMLEKSGVWPEMLARVKLADDSSEYLSTLRVFAEHLESPP